MAARAAHKGRNVAQGASKVEVERAAVRLETHDHEARVLFRLATAVGALVRACTRAVRARVLRANLRDDTTDMCGAEDCGRSRPAPWTCSRISDTS